jgi:hypothetical protein
MISLAVVHSRFRHPMLNHRNSFSSRLDGSRDLAQAQSASRLSGAAQGRPTRSLPDDFAHLEPLSGRVGQWVFCRWRVLRGSQ